MVLATQPRVSRNSRYCTAPNRATTSFRQITTVDGIGRNLTATLDSRGNRTALQLPDGSLFTNTWDAASRLTGILNPYNEQTSIAYDALYRETRRVLANGCSVSRTWDAAGRETVLGNDNSSNLALSLYSATYDAASNRTAVVELDGTRVSYTNDAAYQLTNEKRSGANGYNNSYSWDPVGNRNTKVTSAGTTNNTFNAANELTVSTPPTGSPTTSSYDGNGNVTLENTGGALTSYSWDSENRMLSVVDATGSTTNAYNAVGLRQSKNVAGTVTNYLWDGQNVLAELDAGLVIQAVYTDLPEIWGSAFSLRRSGTSSFYLPDHQGNTRQLASAAQTVTDTLLTDAWGVELASTGSTVNPYRAFGAWGYYRDTEGRLYVRARHLEAAHGRWFGRDPIGRFPAADYGYTDGQPVMYLDPSGAISAVALKGFGKYGNSPNPQYPGCCCGGYTADTTLRLDFPHKGGFIIQYVKVYVNATECGPGDMIKCHYLEAFPNTGPMSPTVDRFSAPQRPGTCGSAHKVGLSRFFNLTESDLSILGFVNQGPNPISPFGQFVDPKQCPVIAMPWRMWLGANGPPPPWFASLRVANEKDARHATGGNWCCKATEPYLSWSHTGALPPDPLVKQSQPC